MLLQRKLKMLYMGLPGRMVTEVSPLIPKPIPSSLVPVTIVASVRARPPGVKTGISCKAGVSRVGVVVMGGVTVET